MFAAAAAADATQTLNEVADLSLGHHGPKATLVSGLSTQAFAAFGPAGANGCAGAIAGWWLGGVARVQVDAFFQCCQAVHELADHGVTRFNGLRQIRSAGWSLSAIAFAHAASLPPALWFGVRWVRNLLGVNRYRAWRVRDVSPNVRRKHQGFLQPPFSTVKYSAR